MRIEPGEAAVLIIRRSEAEPTKYWTAVRKATSSFDPTTNDVQLFDQVAVLELGDRLPLAEALENAIATIRSIEP